MRGENVFDPILATLSLTLTSDQLDLLQRHLDLLLRWNRKINLTSLRSPEEIVRRHFSESLFLVKHIPAGTQTIVDIGSGAGFPGFPAAVMLPEARVTLVESVGKKATFLKELSRGVNNVEVFHGRLEDLDGSFDLGVIRGVALAPLLGVISQKVSDLACLTGADEARTLATYGPFQWQEPLPTPWKSGSVLLVNVPRGTF